jgi:hypothetical protein
MILCQEEKRAVLQAKVAKIKEFASQVLWLQNSKKASCKHGVTGRESEVSGFGIDQATRRIKLGRHETVNLGLLSCLMDCIVFNKVF